MDKHEKESETIANRNLKIVKSVKIKFKQINIFKHDSGQT